MVMTDDLTFQWRGRADSTLQDTVAITAALFGNMGLVVNFRSLYSLRMLTTSLLGC
jgi:hypothetical protein